MANEKEQLPGKGRVATARTPTQRHAIICDAQKALVLAARAVPSADYNGNDREIARRRLFDAALDYARLVRLHLRDR